MMLQALTNDKISLVDKRQVNQNLILPAVDLINDAVIDLG
jgi:hypothetical protein